MKIRKEYTCPLEIAHDILKGKWKTIILWQLTHGRTSLSKLEQDIGGISQKMLLQQLKELMDFGLVEKYNYEGYPLRVEYYLSDKGGQKIKEVLMNLQEIGINYLLDHGQEACLIKKGIPYKKD